MMIFTPDDYIAYDSPAISIGKKKRIPWTKFRMERFPEREVEKNSAVVVCTVLVKVASMS